jgi:prepilin-type N-terminal cleavage/methylation domain-containing protein
MRPDTNRRCKGRTRLRLLGMSMRNRRKGMSLVELLVVIGIIAVVTGMLLTTMRKVFKIVNDMRADSATLSTLIQQDEKPPEACA